MRMRRLTLLILLLGTTSCIPTRLTPENYQQTLDKKSQLSFLTFDTAFKEQHYPAPGWKLRLQLYRKGKSGFITDLVEKEETQYLYHLSPGTYTLRRVEMVSMDGGTRIGLLDLDKTILLQPGTIHYMGSIMMHKTAWSTNASAQTMPPFTYLQAGMEKQALSKQFAAGWVIDWQDKQEQSLTNLFTSYPQLSGMKVTNLLISNANQNTNMN